MKERYTVNIPVVPLACAASSDVSGSLLEVNAQPQGYSEDPTDQAQTLDAQADRKQWDRVAAPLRQAGLYQSGCTAASAVRKLALKKPILALYQRLNKLAYIDTLRLHLAAARVPTEWQTAGGNIEGHSAELGLALVLLLAASQAPHRLVMATGRLGGQPPGTSYEDPDIEILPVGKLPEKLRLIEGLATEKKLPRGPQHTDPVWLFTPVTLDKAGQPIAVDSLIEVGRLKELGVTVIPVKTLKEAAHRLQAERARWMWQDSAAWVGGIFCIALVLVKVMDGGRKLRLPVVSPLLEIQALDQNKKAPEPLQSRPTVYFDETLVLRFSVHPHEFRYLLQLHSDGDAYIEALPADKDKKQMPMGVFSSTSVNTLTLMMLVMDESWSIDRQKKLAETLSALRLQPQLPSRVQYRFAMDQCISEEISEPVSTFTPKGPKAPIKDPPFAAVCANWSKQLLETLKQHTSGTVRLSGYTFKIGRY